MANRRNRWLQSIIGLGLLMILTAGLVMIVRRVPAQVQTRQEKATPVEVAQVTPPDSPVVTVVVVGTIYPTETPPPTFTPLPTPTLRPEPTATPVPLPSPALDASGSLFYAVRTKFNTGPGGYVTEGDIYQVQINAKGELASQAKPTKLGWVQPYSLDRSLVSFVAHTMAGDHVVTLDPKSGKIKPVKASMTHYTSFSGWHPNNQEMLYRVDQSTSDGLWLMSLETDDRTIVVQQDPLYIQDAAISPDGQRIVYVQQKGIGAPGELWTVFADGSSPRLLLSDGIISGLSWSPDNQKIAFLGGGEGLCVMQLDDAACKTVAKNLNIGHGFVPAWSPDGRYLAYVTFDSNLATSNPAKQNQSQDPDKEAFIGSNIYIVNVETGEATMPVTLEASKQISGYIDPTWSPDGKKLAFAALHNGQAGLWVVNVDGTGLHQVAEAPDLIRFPVWTR